MQEIFLPVSILIYSPFYAVSNYGRVKSLRNNRIMKTCPRNGYESLGFCHKDQKANYTVHRLVALTFIANPQNLEFVNHKDGNKLNNTVGNLEWISPSDNALHSVRVLHNKRATVAVKQLTLTGELVATFDSIKEAAEATGASSKKIPSVCNGSRQQTAGYRWEYVNDPFSEIPVGKTLEDYPNYIITTTGQVYSLWTKRYLVLNKQMSGYSAIGLSNGVKKDFYVHVLVATLYLEQLPGKSQVNHKDRDKSNNDVSNLEWVTPSENMIHVKETNKMGENKKKVVLIVPKIRENISNNSVCSTTNLIGKLIGGSGENSDNKVIT